MKLFIFIGMILFSYLGWWLGELVTDDFLVLLLLSSVTSIGGIVVGWWVARQLELQ